MNWNDFFKYKDGKLFWKVTRNNRVKAGDEAGNQHRLGYLNVRVNNVLRPVHRVVWEMHNGKVPHGLEIDHINRIKQDNRIENLRAVTKRQNCCNLSTNTSGVPGVIWCKQQNKWRARIWVNGKNKNLGLFEKIEDAKNARNAAEKIFI